jgi:hypothetical protein
MFQTRLPDDFADRVHEYKDERHMTKSEAMRALIRAGLEAAEDDQDDQGDVDEAEDAERDRTDRLTALARLAEKAAVLTVVFSFLSLFVPLLAVAGIVGLGLTIGTFGSDLIVNISLVAAVGAMMTFAVSVASIALVAYLVAAHRIEAGWFGRRVESALPNGEVKA